MSKFPRNRVYPVSTPLLVLFFSLQPTLRPFCVHGHGKIVARARCRACYFRVLIDTSEAVTLANPAENRFALRPFLKLYFAIELSSLLFLFIYLFKNLFVRHNPFCFRAFPIVANKSEGKIRSRGEI